MIVVFNVEKSGYVNCPDLGFTVTEHEWNLNVIPQRDNIVDLFPFIEDDNENVSLSIPAGCSVNDPMGAVLSEAARIQYIVSGIKWSKNENGAYCQIDLTTP